MEKFFNSLTFNDYPPHEILDKSFYTDSLKNLSFQYRTIKGDRLIAFIALSNEGASIMIPNIDNQSKGCRILNLYVEPISKNKTTSINTALLTSLLDEAELYIKGWVDSNRDFAFDYLWFNLEDFESEDAITIIGDVVTYNGVAYKVFER